MRPVILQNMNGQILWREEVGTGFRGLMLTEKTGGGHALVIFERQGRQVGNFGHVVPSAHRQLGLQKRILLSFTDLFFGKAPTLHHHISNPFPHPGFIEKGRENLRNIPETSTSLYSTGSTPHNTPDPPRSNTSSP